jgi:lysozyme
MVYSKTGQQLTERFESCRLTAYQDVRGIWTIGWGHTPAAPDMTCSQEQADTWLLSDTQTAQDAVNELVTVPLTQGEFDALVDFVFNVGRGNFKHSTMLEKLNGGNYQAAAAQFDLWDKSGGKIVAGLLRRRQAEANEFQS